MILPIIMCKAPVPGQVKTRLLTEYTPEQAAEIHAAMATTVIQRVSTISPEAWLAADDIHHPFFQGFDLRIVEQGKGDLGDRLTRLLLQACQEKAGGILFVGTDSPHMPESRLHQAVQALEKVQVVLGPVEDGGYDLIGLSGPYSELFDHIDWGTNRVLSQALEHAAQSGLKTQCLDTGFDVDEPADLIRAYQAGWREAGRWLA